MSASTTWTQPPTGSSALGGAVYVPPTNSNIGRISVVADPQTATLGVGQGLKTGQRQRADLGKPGRVGWHELLAADWKKAFAFYGELFGWQKADAEIGPTDAYQLFSAGGQTIGGMFTKRPTDPIPFWLYYFNVDDIDAAVERVKTAGGRIFEGPLEMPGGSWIARCGDPQGAAFALQGKRNRDAVGWSTEWGEFSSKGRLVTPARGRAAPGDVNRLPVRSRPARCPGRPLAAATAGLGGGLSCRFDQEM